MAAEYTVNVTGVPLQTTEGTALMLSTTGSAFTITLTDEIAVHGPSTAVTVYTYVPAIVGLTPTDAPDNVVAIPLPVAGEADQLYV